MAQFDVYGNDTSQFGTESDWARMWDGKLQLRNADGSWAYAGTPEHQESYGYVSKAVNDPELDRFIKYARENPTALNAEQKAFMANPLLGADSFGQGGRWGGALNLFDNQISPQQSGALAISNMSQYLTPEQLVAGQQFVQQESPAAQSARDDPDNGMGDLMTLAMLAAAIYSGGTALGAWGAGAGGAAGAGGLAAADAMAGLIPASELGAWAGTAGAGLGGLANAGYIDALGGMTDATGTALSGWGDIAGTAAAAGSGAMDFSNLGDLWNFGDTAGGSTLSDLQAAADQFGWSDLASPGTTAGANADIGGSGWLSTIIEQAKADPLGTAAQAVKSVFGNDWMKTIGSLGTAALNAYSSNQQTGALEDMAKRYEGYGAPYRQRLSDLYADPTSFLSSKEVQTPVDLGTQSLMRSLSTQGNPFGSGNALQQGQSYASDQLFSRLGQEKDRLAGFGGLASYNAAAPAAATNAISSGQGPYIGAAKAMGDIFNPPQTPAQQAAEWMKVMGR